MKRFAPILLVVLPAAFAAAEEVQPPAPASLGALLREAERENPALRAATARLEAARRLPSQAGALPDPEAAVAYTNDGLDEFTLGEREFSQLSLSWTQEVPYPGKRRTAAGVAVEEIGIAEHDLNRVRLEILAAIKIGFADLYRLDRTAAILGEAQATLKSLAEAAMRRYEVGEGIQESVLKAQTEVLRLEAELARVAQDRREAEVRLNAAVGRAADTPIGPVTALPEAALPDDPEALAESAVLGSPEVGSLEAAVRRSDASVQLARLGLKPDFIWSAAYQYREDLDPMVMGMFGLRLPVYRARKQAQALLQAESEAVAARHDLADLQIRTRASVREIVARFERADRLVALFGRGVVPQARSALESAQASYGVGRIGFLDLLNDLAVLFDARVEEASQEADRLQAVAALEPLLGRDLIRVPEDPGSEGGGDVSVR